MKKSLILPNGRFFRLANEAETTQPGVNLTVVIFVDIFRGDLSVIIFWRNE